MQQNAKCVKKFIELYAVTAVRSWQATGYGHPALSVHSLRHWRQDVQVPEKVSLRPRSRRPDISDADVSKVKTAS